MTGATFAGGDQLGVRGRIKPGWGKAYGLLGSCASLVCGGGMARTACARRCLDDWWTLSQVVTTMTQTLL